MSKKKKIIFQSHKNKDGVYYEDMSFKKLCDGVYYEDNEEGTFYYKKGDLHRKDGPACIWDNGDREWLVNGEYHREDGPAAEYEDEKVWYIRNKCVFSDTTNKLQFYPEASKEFIKSIVLYVLSK